VIFRFKDFSVSRLFLIFEGLSFSFGKFGIGKKSLFDFENLGLRIFVRSRMTIKTKAKEK